MIASRPRRLNCFSQYCHRRPLERVAQLCKRLHIMTDYVKAMGAAAFGTRLRRFSEMLDRQVRDVYFALDVEFEPRWFPIVNVLRAKQTSSVGELASLLGITHAAISQLRRELVDAGLVRASADPADGRRQILQLSAAGSRMVAKLDPVWHAIARATEALLSKTAPHILRELAEAEASLIRKSMNLRVERMMSADAA